MGPEISIKKRAAMQVFVVLAASRGSGLRNQSIKSCIPGWGERREELMGLLPHPTIPLILPPCEVTLSPLPQGSLSATVRLPVRSSTLLGIGVNVFQGGLEQIPSFRAQSTPVITCVQQGYRDRQAGETETGEPVNQEREIPQVVLQYRLARDQH